LRLCLLILAFLCFFTLAINLSFGRAPVTAADEFCVTPALRAVFFCTGRRSGWWQGPWIIIAGSDKMRFAEEISQAVSPDL
jgi:hypothetical protein